MGYTDVPCKTVVKTADGAVGLQCFVYWITLRDTGGNLSVELNDSTDNSGSDLWDGAVLQNSCLHAVFDPPIEFTADCYVDVTGTTPAVTVGYLPHV